MVCCCAISGVGKNPPIPPMMIPELMIVGPGIHPCTIARRSAVSHRALLPVRTMQPDASIWMPLTPPDRAQRSTPAHV
jgi:hypothetical protein